MKIILVVLCILVVELIVNEIGLQRQIDYLVSCANHHTEALNDHTKALNSHSEAIQRLSK